MAGVILPARRWITLAAVLLGSGAWTACNSESGESSAAKIQAALQPADKELPATLAETQLFADGLTPVRGVLSYDVKVPLWSDGAQKRRFIYLPPGAQVEQDAATGAFVFPVGTTFVKHFASESNADAPVETRMITRKDDGQWHFVTYVWQDDGTTVANTRPKKVAKEGQDYRLPSEQECKMCHGDPATILGFSPRQLNFTTSTGDNQLALLAGSNIFTTPVADLQAVKAHDDPHDTALPLLARARAYMSVNCGTCHNPTGPEKANLLDLRIDAVDTKLLSEGKIVPGNPDASILWQRYTATTDRMPLISLRQDPLGADLLRQMILQWTP